MANTPALTPSTEKPEETKREKFVRLANARTAKVLDAIGTLNGLASPANYEFNDDDWAKIFSAITSELGKLEQRVKNPTTAAKATGGILSL